MPQSICHMDETVFFWSASPNRSLAKRGRLLWLCLIGGNAAIISAVALAIGAWPVVPFAGLEVLLIGGAFWYLAQHDRDFERLQIGRFDFSWQRRDGSKSLALTGSMAWATVHWVAGDRGPRLLLRYAGRQIELGAGVSLEDRRSLASSMSDHGVRLSAAAQ